MRPCDALPAFRSRPWTQHHGCSGIAARTARFYRHYTTGMCLSRARPIETASERSAHLAQFSPTLPMALLVVQRESRIPGRPPSSAVAIAQWRRSSAAKGRGSPEQRASQRRSRWIPSSASSTRAARCQLARLFVIAASPSTWRLDVRLCLRAAIGLRCHHLKQDWPATWFNWANGRYTPSQYVQRADLAWLQTGPFTHNIPGLVPLLAT